MKNNTLLGLIFAFACSGLLVASASEKEWSDKYYGGFGTNDGTSAITIFHNFSQEVPEGLKAEVLAEIIDRAKQQHDNKIIWAVLSFLNGSEGRQIEWNNHLRDSLYPLAKSPDEVVRSLLVDLLGHVRKDDARELILSFQNDPSEKVRSSFIHSIVEWPDGEQIYQKFIQDHQSDSNYAASIQYAKNCILANRKVLKDSNKSQK